MTIEPRLVVTGPSPTGDATVVADRHPDPVTVSALPGAGFYLMWGTADGTPKVGEDDPAPVVRPYFPGVGGSRAIFLRWAPHSSDPQPATDPQQAADEVAEKLPGLLEPFEDGDDGIAHDRHRRLRDLPGGGAGAHPGQGEEVTLRAGTCVVQLGTRHTWVNRSDRPALMCYVQLGAVRV